MLKRLLRLSGFALPAFLFVFHATLGSEANAPTPWPPKTDIPQDPAVVSGILDNGVRYALMVNHEPRDRASLRLLVRAGSLDETDEQRGLAHYLEHMAFNGTTHFAADTLVEWFQRNGMSFGGDSNAATGFETTTYMLELAHSDSKTVREGLEVFRDFADGMLLDPKEIDKERGIIFSEKRARDSVEFRTAMDEFGFILPDTLPPERFPIGVTETLDAANAERLRAFYDAWYEPRNFIIVVVGEIDIDATRQLLEEAFGPMKPRASIPERADRGRVIPAHEPVAKVHRETEASSVSVAIEVAAPFERQPDSIADRIRDLPLNAANAIISRRLAELAKKENAPFNFGSAGSSEAFDFAKVTSIELTGPPERWKDSLAVADQEIRRALQYGFSPVELKEITANIINSLEEAVRSAPTRRSPGLASGLANAIYRDRVFSTPETNLSVMRPAVEALTVDACLSALRKAWSESAPRIFVSGHLQESDTAQVVIDTFTASGSVPVQPPEAPTDEPFGYTDFGPPGEVTHRKHIDDLDITLVEFSNGVRLNLKKTDFRANSISLSARLGGGQLELPRDRPELALIAGALVSEGGLGKHSKDDLRRILAGRTVGVGFSVGNDAFNFGGGTSPKDLQLEFQLLCASITDPGFREDALALIRRGVDQSYERMIHLPGGVAQIKIPPLLASGDPRFGTPPLNKLLSVSAEDVRAWLMPAFSHEDLEVAVVGDIDVEKTIRIAAATIGALPQREPRKSYADARVVHYPKVAPESSFDVATEIQKALVLIYWPTDDGFDIPRTRRLNLVASVVSDRLRKVIREELGAAYSPHASSSPSDTYPGYGLFSVSVQVDPTQTETVKNAILSLASDIRTNGVTDDELDRALEPAITAIHESARQNGYWLNAVLQEAQTRPEFLDYARNRESDYKSITTADLDDLASRYFDNTRAARFIVRPVPDANGASPDEPVPPSGP